MTRTRMSALAVGFAMVTALTGFATSAQAAQEPSQLLPVDTVTLTGPGDDDSFSTRLNPDTCHSALDNGQSYAVTATSASPGTDGVSPGESPGLKCEAGKKNALTLATFTVRAPLTLCGPDPEPDVVISLMPVAGPKGIQDKMTGPQLVTVTVQNVPLCETGNPPPTEGTTAAAPAVANAYLNADDGSLTAACKDSVVYTGKGWRGAVISAVAAWMPKPESVKNVLDEDEWVAYVQTEVRHICGYGGTDAPVPVAPEPFAELPHYAP